MRAVLVGCGAMSEAWFLCAKQQNIDIVGVVDIDAARAESRVKQFELSADFGSDLVPMLTKHSPDVLFDVVIPKARHAVVSAGFDAGCHVLSEKPMAESMDEARDLVSRATVAGKIHAIIQNRRYDAQIRRIKRLLDSGLLGEITSIHVDYFMAPHIGGYREQLPHILIHDMAIHTFDAARYLANEAAAKAVYAHEWDAKGSWFQQGSSATAIFELAGNVPFIYRGSWTAEGLMTSWESTWRIVCTLGTILWDGGTDIRAQRVDGADGFFRPLADVAIPPADPLDRVGAHYGVMLDFAAAVAGGPVPETVGHENIKSLAMVFGAIRSSETKSRVEFVDAV